MTKTVQELENDAQICLSEIRHLWMRFVDIVNEIKQRKKLSVKEWDNYCRETFGYAASTIRAYNTSAEYAKIIEAVVGVTIQESTARNLNAALPKDISKEERLRIAPLVYSLTMASSDKPTKSEFKAVYDTIEEYQGTGGYVSLEGESVHILELATNQAIEEAHKRQKQHIIDNSKKKIPLESELQVRYDENGDLCYVLSDLDPLLFPVLMIGKKYKFWPDADLFESQEQDTTDIEPIINKVNWDKALQEILDNE